MTIISKDIYFQFKNVVGSKHEEKTSKLIETLKTNCLKPPPRHVDHHANGFPDPRFGHSNVHSDYILEYNQINKSHKESKI